MADSLPVYSAREVSCAWGMVNFEGFSGDNIVSMEYNSDLTTETVSCDGKLATSVTPDRTGTVTVELLQTSATHAILTGILAAQESSGDTSVLFRSDFVVSDPSGSAGYIARNAYLKKAPTLGLGVEQQTREWTFYAERIEPLNAARGISASSAIIQDVLSVVSGMRSLISRF